MRPSVSGSYEYALFAYDATEWLRSDRESDKERETERAIETERQREREKDREW